MPTSQCKPVIPGRLLLSDFLAPRGLSIQALARQIGLTRKHLSNIVNGHVRVTPSTAARLARALGTSPALWITLQSAIDIFEAEQELRAELDLTARAA